jgi:predicted tellurium resistance membrane protein TerC
MSYEIIIALVTLIALEIILGIDNIIFISILAGKLPVDQQKKARRVGIILAAGIRLLLLTAAAWIMRLQEDLFTVFGHAISGKDIILILGGIFLIYKSAKEIYEKTESEEGPQGLRLNSVSFKNVIGQILLLDIVFSVDSIITAVGLVDELWIMYVAVILSVLIILVAAAPISNFVNRHPSFKILALCFLLMIGFALLVEGFEVKIPKGYIYFSMAFAIFVDVMQMRLQKKSKGHPIK